jgi:hypothetical protein
MKDRSKETRTIQRHEKLVLNGIRIGIKGLTINGLHGGLDEGEQSQNSSLPIYATEQLDF